MGTQHSFARRTNLWANPEETDRCFGRPFQRSHYRRCCHEPGSGRILPSHQVPVHHRLWHDGVCAINQLRSLERIHPDFFRASARHHGSRIYKENPEAEIGEIQVRGENVMTGYYKNPEATKEVFTEDGWLRTGDLGKLDEKGNLYIRGRSKTMILSSSGQNIFPEEIEARLNNLPFVLESLVIERNKKLVALVYADYEALDSLGLNQEENLKTIMNENLKNLNSSVASYEKVSQIQLYPTEFEKTPKRSIKRYLYNSIAED